MDEFNVFANILAFIFIYYIALKLEKIEAKIDKLNKESQ